MDLLEKQEPLPVEEKALTLKGVVAEYVRGEDSGGNKRSSQDLDAEIASVSALIAEAQPVEAESVKVLRKRLSDLKCARESNDITAPRIDMSFLQQFKKAANGMLVPAFCVFSIGNPLCKVRYSIARRLPAAGVWLELLTLLGLLLTYLPLLVCLGTLTLKCMVALGISHSTAGQLAIIVTQFEIALMFQEMFRLENRWAMSTYVTVSAQPSVFKQWLPDQIAKELIQAHRWAGRGKRITLEAKFSGLLPERVRHRISESRVLFDEMLLITEAPNWSYNVQTIIPVGDPLLIGRKGRNFYLLDEFDTTPAEYWVAREMTA
jgi:hypothetical protein